MKHNDLLRKSLEETLDFYDLEAFPIPSLTMFFKVDVLMSWYADILLKEMAAAVNDVVSVCLPFLVFNLYFFCNQF